MTKRNIFAPAKLISCNRGLVSKIIIVALSVGAARMDTSILMIFDHVIGRTGTGLQLGLLASANTTE
jgi:hypothetical protein